LGYKRQRIALAVIVFQLVAPRDCRKSDHCNSVVKLLGFDLGENPGGVTLIR